MMKYDNIVRDICMTSWERLQQEKSRTEANGDKVSEDLQGEIDGWIGVVLVLSFMRGVKPSIKDMCDHLGVSGTLISAPLKNLMLNGMFRENRHVKNDEVLLGIHSDTASTRRAWCWIAGTAAGFCGLRN